MSALQADSVPTSSPAHPISSNVRAMVTRSSALSYCKRIRGDDQYSLQVEGYIAEHSDAPFSHGICPTCDKTVTAELDAAARGRAIAAFASS